MNNYKQVCKKCGSKEVARCKWINVNDQEMYDADSGTTLEWCFGECQEQTNIIDSEDFRVWQPEFDENGNIMGHEQDLGSLFSFEVYSSKEKLLEDFPNCKPIEYKYNDIEDFLIIQ